MTKPDAYPSEPIELFEHFYRFTQIPRPSAEEEEMVKYPGWQPVFDNPLLAQTGDLYQELFGQAPRLGAPS